MTVRIDLTFAQIENKAQLARELANVTQDTKDFKKEDVSLAVTLLGSVVESSETIQEKEVGYIHAVLTAHMT